MYVMFGGLVNFVVGITNIAALEVMQGSCLSLPSEFYVPDAQIDLTQIGTQW